MREQCSVRTSVDVDEAFGIIEPYFIAVRERFIRSGARRVKKTRLEVARWVHDSPRHFAATEDTGHAIVIAPEFCELPPETVLAILSHEFGHAVDFLYPATYFVMDDGELVELPPVPLRAFEDKREEQTNYARARAWEKRDKDMVERTADRIAEHMTGRLIGYSGPCELQSFDRGERPRRSGLR